MSELKEEPIQAVEESLNKTAMYIQENRKSLSLILGTVIGLLGGYIFYKYVYVAKQEKLAQAEMFMAEQYFAQDSLNKAINGDGKNPGFIEIADNYGVTKSGNLAHYYLGISYLRKGEFEKAIEELSDFNSDDIMLSSVALGATGDAHLELGHKEEAISFYQKAADKNSNVLTSPIYLKKTGLVYQEMGNYADAVKAFERIKADYNKSNEARDIEKYIAHAKALGNL